MKRILLLIAALLLPFAASAGSYTGKVKFLHMDSDSDGIMLVHTATVITSYPACSVNNRFVLDTKTASGKAQLAVIMTAYALGKDLVIVGTGFCALGNAGEEIQYLYTSDP